MSRFMGCTAAILALLALSACNMLATRATEPIDGGSAPVEYQLGPGDRIDIVIYEEPLLSRNYLVDDTGVVSLPVIGPFKLEGMTLRQTEAALVEMLGEQLKVKDPRVSVNIVDYRPVFIMGEVTQPGSYPYVSGMTVLSAVAIAGGYTTRAQNDGINIVRVSDPDRAPKLADEYTLLAPGDIVKIPERFF